MATASSSGNQHPDSEVSCLRYITHPEVMIDAAVPVPRWGLSDVGMQRTRAMIDQPWFERVGSIVSSAEQKALETAAIMATALGIAVEVRPETGEIDRSSTGFVPHDRHEELADRMFAAPTQAADGWERAIDAQQRVVTALADILVHEGDADVAVVGHGAVGTFLYCHLSDHPIDRMHDQTSPGNYFTFDRRRRAVVHGWRPIDELVAG